MTADFELHPIGITEEERPLAAEALDLSDIGSGFYQTIAYGLEGVMRVDGERIVIDRATTALLRSGRR